MRMKFMMAVFLALALAEATAQTPTIYKCRRPGHAVVYQDSPCGPRQTQLPFDDQASGIDVAAATTAATATVPESRYGKDLGGPTKVANPLDDPNFRKQLAEATTSPPAQRPVDGDSSARYMEPIAQTIAGLLFASVLVGVVAFKARKRAPKGDERQPSMPTTEHAAPR